MSFRQALLAATMLALPVAAQAQPVTGLYVGAGAGLNLLMESDIELSRNFGLGQGGNGSVEFNPGWAGVLSLGWGFGNGVRAELEGNFRDNRVSGASGFSALTGPLTTNGRARSYGVMANAFYDFDLGMDLPVMPYVGLGAGYVWHEHKGARVTGRNTGALIDDKDGNFAYQAILGAALPLDDVAPGLAVTAEYRFLGTLNPELSASVGTARGTAEVQNFNHSLLIGLRYAFNTAAPAPAPVVAAPAAAPAPARTFLVFFDFDRADLTDRARAIIGEAAQNAQRTGSARIEVAGHADRSGTPQYNQALSERRARAVAAELQRRGIAGTAINVQAFGESRPLVPTADGAREPQNRRVEIVLR